MAAHALRLRLDGAALRHNFRWLEQRAGRPATAVVKADAYRLGARGVVGQLLAAGCRQFAVSNWQEAAGLADLAPDLVVLHGFRPEDAGLAAALPGVRPVLGSLAQIAAWKASFPGRAAELMVDTGINRLGLAMAEMGEANGLDLQRVHSHLACADEPDHPMNARQIARFREVVAAFPGVPHLLANTAGILLGGAAFDGVRPGIGLYGGRPQPEVPIRQVVYPEAELLQVREIGAGDSVGYGATFVARQQTAVGVINLGYADGLPRLLGPALRFHARGQRFAVVGRVSMDLITLDMTGADARAGDWIGLDFDLPTLEQAGVLGQYELLTALSPRYARMWF